MAELDLTHTPQASVNIPPTSASTNMFYDIDGILKQKDWTGFVSNIGIASGSTGATQYWAPGTALPKV